MTRRKNSNVDNRAYKFRLYPNAQQTVLINYKSNLETVRPYL